MKSRKELPIAPKQEAQPHSEKSSALHTVEGQTEPDATISNVVEKSDEMGWDGPPLISSPFMSSSKVSAPNEQADSLFGQALPDIKASRTAGATLGAAGSTRSMKFVSQKIDSARVEPHLVAITQPRSGYCEELRSLRTHVLHASKKRKMQTIVIASAGAGEGKSLMALNLSWLLAQTDGVRALVIDSDLRHPCLHDYLGVKATIGLSDIFSDTATIEDTIIKLEPSGLHLLPGGRARDDVAELLSGPRFTQLLDQVRNMFDFVVIDAPPLGVFTDAAVLIDQSDGALLIVRAGKTRYAIVDRLLATLPRERMLGVVVNRGHDRLNEGLDYYNQRERGSGGRYATA
jgi:capsular exopolysaccharide synthesis family protein